MNNKIKQEINNIKIPDGLHKRSKLGISKAKSELGGHKFQFSKIMPYVAMIAVVAILLPLVMFQLIRYSPNPLVKSSDKIKSSDNSSLWVGVSPDGKWEAKLLKTKEGTSFVYDGFFYWKGTKKELKDVKVIMHQYIVNGKFRAGNKKEIKGFKIPNGKFQFVTTGMPKSSDKVKAIVHWNENGEKYGDTLPLSKYVSKNFTHATKFYGFPIPKKATIGHQNNKSTCYKWKPFKPEFGIPSTYDTAIEKYGWKYNGSGSIGSEWFYKKGKHWVDFQSGGSYGVFCLIKDLKPTDVIKK